MQRVINFSGGKTSALMTILEYKPGDIVLFCDTGREHPKTYKFVTDFEAFEGIPVVRIQRLGGFEGILSRRKNKTLPNRQRRFCTDDLKVKAAKQYLRSIGIRRYENLIGFRFDEPKRVKAHKEKFVKVKTKFPLYDRRITKAQVNEYWKGKPFDLEIPHILGNCTLCFMKGKNAITAILTHYPELAEPWIADEEKNSKKGHTYLPGVSIRQLLNIAQNNLFKGYDLDEVTPAFDCACTS
jgi:glycosyltransferase involved in cell wall biosynthesis